MKVLVTGGVRSGKSRHAETLATAMAARGLAVTYVAPGPSPDGDDDWADRVAAHRARRPQTWTTLESHDLPAALATPGVVLVDCLGTWLTALLDERDLWEAPSDVALGVVERLLRDMETALAQRDDVVIVTNEVGLGVVPSHRSGRVFRDLLGVVNQRVAGACDEVHLVVAGRVVVL